MLMGPCKKATTNTNIDLVSACRSCFISNDTLIDGDDTYLAFMRKTKRSFWSTAAATVKNSKKRHKKKCFVRAHTLNVCTVVAKCIETSLRVTAIASIAASPHSN